MKTGKQNPVLNFVYGGGLVVGDKIPKDVQDDLGYSNLRQFFAAELGFDAIVMDYRLRSHGASYPSGGTDLDNVMRWVLDRYQDQGSRDVYVVGNSVGGLYTATWLFAEYFETTGAALLNGNGNEHVHLAGAVFLGSSQRLHPEGPMKYVLEAYYGSQDRVTANEPTRLMLNLINKAQPAKRSKMPRILSVVSEFDPEFIVDSMMKFHQLWIERGGEGEFVSLKGHNHISPPLSLGTGLDQEEEWGHMMGCWLMNGAR